MTVYEDSLSAQRKPKTSNRAILISFAIGFTLSFIFLFLHPFSNAPEWYSWFNPMYQKYVGEQIVIYALAGIGAYVSLKMRNTVILSFCTGVAACPIILVIIGSLLI